MKYCIKCGKEIVNDADFCPHCGNAQQTHIIENNPETVTSIIPESTLPRKNHHVMGYDEDYEDNSTNRAFSVWVWIGWITFFLGFIPLFIFSLLTVVAFIIGLVLYVKGNKRFSNHGTILMCVSAGMFIIEMILGATGFM